MIEGTLSLDTAHITDQLKKATVVVNERSDTIGEVSESRKTKYIRDA